MRRAESRYPISIDTRRVYGFTHTSDEALQQLLFLRDEKAFRNETRCSIFRPGDHRPLESQSWTPADLHIVEISSAKKITAFEDSLQINYLYRHFADFFSSTERTSRFWSLAKRERPEALHDFLLGEPSYMQLSSEERALLAAIRLEQQDFDAILADMQQIVEHLGIDRVLFVTHVNALTQDGGVIGERDRVVRMVKTAAQQLGVSCFDPTAAMFQFGQKAAMENGGRDLTHYTFSFSDRVYAEIHKEFIAPQLLQSSSAGSDEEDVGRQQLLADSIDAIMEFDDFFDGTRRLFDALRREPKALPLRQVHGKLLLKLGDFSGARREFEGLDKQSALAQEGRIALLDTLIALDDWQGALDVVETLLGEEYASTGIYSHAAKASEMLGHAEAALDFWKQAFRADRANLEAALQAHVLTREINTPEQLGAWQQEIVDSVELDADSAFGFLRWAIDACESRLLPEAFAIMARVDFSRAGELFAEMLQSGDFAAIAACLEKMSQLEDLDRDAARQRDKLAAQVGEVAEAQRSAGDLAAAHMLAVAAAKIRGGRDARKIGRATAVEIREAIQGAYSEGRYADVIRLGDQAPKLAMEVSGVPIRWAISLHRLERSDEALDLLLRAHEHCPDDLKIWRWLGRIGTVLGRYEIALPYYCKLRDCADPNARQFDGEIDRFLTRAEPRALRRLREATDSGEFQLALDLADCLRGEVKEEERLDRLVSRLKRVLWKRLRAIESADGDADSDRDERETLLHQLLRLEPDNTVYLRRTALVFMQGDRFADAAAMWERLDRLEPSKESNLRNLRRCRILALRQQPAQAA